LNSAEGLVGHACVARDNSCGSIPAIDGGIGQSPDGGARTDGGTSHPGADGGAQQSGTDGGTQQPGTDGGSSSWSCNNYVAPTTAASCVCATGKRCTANGCYQNRYCDLNANPPYCAALPQDCGGPPKLTDALSVGGPVTANITGKSGGTIDRLLFAVVGDTRPATVDDPAAYPTSVITGIYSKLASVTPQPPLLITTGDYAFATPGKNTASPQYTTYLTAQSAFKGVVWPVMGNHECDGATDSNCFPTDSTSKANISTWIKAFLSPIGETNPYYERDVNASDGSWTAKFIFLAPNSWNTAQQTFLTTQLARQTTYTFVVRHEPSAAEELPGSTMAPGTSAIDPILRSNASDITLVIEGHSHSFYFYDYTDSTDGTEVFPKEVIVGNGGAPQTTASTIGFTVIAQRTADNAIVLTSYDYTTGMATYSFAISPTGHYIP
jgi:hypothetical protein